MIPTFPKFKKLELKDKQEIEAYTKQFPSYSDYNFTSLWCWNINNETETSFLNNNLVVKFHDYLTCEPFYSFLGNNKVIETANTLLDLSIKKGLKPELKLIPEHNFVLGLDIYKHFNIKEDRDNFDYILSVEELFHAKGGKYANYRKLIRRFNILYPSCVFKTLNLKDEKIGKEILLLFKKWAKLKKNPSRKVKYELEVIQNILRTNGLNLFSVGIYDKNLLIAFFITDIKHREYAMSHFIKCDLRYKGVYQISRDYFVKHIYQAGHKFINIQQDLGISTLRFAKEQWNPVIYLKKYKILEK